MLVRQGDGTPQPSSLAEIAFYTYDDIVDSIRSLFTDNTYTAVASGATQAKIDELRARLESGDGYYVNKEIPLISGQPGHIPILVPCCDRIPLERLWEPFVQTGNIDQVVHALLFVKLKGDSAALPPSTCSPMGFKVSVVDPLESQQAIKSDSASLP